jgi:hypothetical protein
VEYRSPVLSHHLTGWRLGRVARVQEAVAAEGERRFLIQDELSAAEAAAAAAAAMGGAGPPPPPPPRQVSIPLLFRGPLRAPLAVPEVLVRLPFAFWSASGPPGFSARPGARVEAIRPDGTAFAATVVEVHGDTAIVRNSDPPAADGAFWASHESALRPAHSEAGSGFGMVMPAAPAAFMSVTELKAHIAAAKTTASLPT